MTYAWTQPGDDGGFHPRVDPVTAWHFRRNSPFLRASDATGDEASLFSMPIGADGFRPQMRDAWRALGVPNPGGPAAGDFEVFTTDDLNDLLEPIEDSFTDPRVHVLPLVASAAVPPGDLVQRRGIGTPHTQRVRHPLPEPPRAIVGVLDYGINIFHHRFRHRSGGTRVTYAWMQGQPRTQGRLTFGAEWQQSDIEAALAVDQGDEDRLLARIGADFSVPGFHALGFHTSHGTHVLDLAAGYEPDDPAGDSLPIIAVSMPPAVTRETSGSMLPLPFVLGLEYIADRARHLMHHTGVVVPVFVNVSFGLTGGPRAGQHRLEQTIDRIAARHRDEVARHMGVEDAPFTVVLAAGNNNLSQGYARAAPGASSLEFGWQLQPADPSANVLELRCAPMEDAAPRRLGMTITVAPPHSDAPLEAIVDLIAGRVVENVWLLERDGAVIGRLSVWRNPAGVATVTLALDATDPGASTRAVAPAGEWRVQVSYDAGESHQLDAWVLRDDVPGGFRDTGRQSYLVDAGYRSRDATGRIAAEDTADADATVRRAGSLNALATGTGEAANRLNVGGYVAATGQPAVYSAAPMPDSDEQIDVSAISDRTPMRAGIRAAGTRSGSRATISGTSVAAPQLVRHLATGAGVLSPSPEAASPRMGAQRLE